MKARQMGRQPTPECASRMRQPCHMAFAAGWQVVVTTYLANSGLRAKGGGRN